MKDGGSQAQTSLSDKDCARLARTWAIKLAFLFTKAKEHDSKLGIKLRILSYKIPNSASILLFLFRSFTSFWQSNSIITDFQPLVTANLMPSMTPCASIMMGDITISILRLPPPWNFPLESLAINPNPPKSTILKLAALVLIFILPSSGEHQLQTEF